MQVLTTSACCCCVTIYKLTSTWCTMHPAGADNQGLVQRLHNLQTFLRQERQAREAAVLRLGEEQARCSVLSSQVQVSLQQVRQLKPQYKGAATVRQTGRVTVLARFTEIWQRGEARDGAAQEKTTGRQAEKLPGPRAHAAGGSLASRPQANNQITAPRRSTRAHKRVKS